MHSIRVTLTESVFDQSLSVLVHPLSWPTVFGTIWQGPDQNRSLPGAVYLDNSLAFSSAFRCCSYKSKKH